MRLFAALFVALFLVCGVALAEHWAYELVAFDYNAVGLDTGDEVRIEWGATVESFLTYNGKFQVVMTMTMEDATQHSFSTVPFPIQGLGSIDISNRFTVPRNIWNNAVSIEVDAMEYLEPVAGSEGL